MKKLNIFLIIASILLISVSICYQKATMHNIQKIVIQQKRKARIHNAVYFRYGCFLC